MRQLQQPAWATKGSKKAAGSLVGSRLPPPYRFDGPQTRLCRRATTDPPDTGPRLPRGTSSPNSCNAPRPRRRPRHRCRAESRDDDARGPGRAAVCTCYLSFELPCRGFGYRGPLPVAAAGPPTPPGVPAEGEKRVRMGESTPFSSLYPSGTLGLRRAIIVCSCHRLGRDLDGVRGAERGPTPRRPPAPA